MISTSLSVSTFFRKLVVAASYPLLASSLLLMWLYYARFHPWKSLGMALGYEPKDKWSKGQMRIISHQSSYNWL